jgi:DNA invertase Pin-like site-specific DNA recombinase
MLRIGYVRPGDGGHGADLSPETDAQIRALKALGCGVVQVEAPTQPDGEDFAALHSILDVIGDGDELVVGRLEHLGVGGRAMLAAVQRLDRRGASLRVVEPALSSQGPGGPALRAVLEAVAAVEPVTAAHPRRAAAGQDIRALQRAGVGPVEIARRLGVSRMTVWRKLKAMEACPN